MSSNAQNAKAAFDRINSIQEIDRIIDRIQHPKNDVDLIEELPIEFGVSRESTQKRIHFLQNTQHKKFPTLTINNEQLEIDKFQGNIENFIGLSVIPTGVVGPLRVKGSAAQGNFFVPLATTEGALVASYHRGAKACLLAGGITSICLLETVQRCPLFKFKDLTEIGQFLSWIFTKMEDFHKIVHDSSNYAQLNDLKFNIEGNQLILTFEYYTGDAAGQNMVTICTNNICEYIIQESPIQPTHWYIESNYSGDKKATAKSFDSVRGKKVTAEVKLSPDIVKTVLKTSVKKMVDYWQSSTIGIVQSGAIGAHGHYANGLTALFIATGQDVACVAEAATGITRMEQTDNGDLYASVTLPNLIVGTVGGGTSLPTQKECLELMGCYGKGNARKYAEICAALILAGELSIAAALSAGHFSDAHKKFGRKG